MVHLRSVCSRVSESSCAALVPFGEKKSRQRHLMSLGKSGQSQLETRTRAWCLCVRYPPAGAAST
jgi:hypothetical protein